MSPNVSHFLHHSVYNFIFASLSELFSQSSCQLYPHTRHRLLFIVLYCCFESPESPSKEHSNSAVVLSRNNLNTSDSIFEPLLIISNVKVKSVVWESDSYRACCTTERWDAEQDDKGNIVKLKNKIKSQQDGQKDSLYSVFSFISEQHRKKQAHASWGKHHAF